MESEPRGSNLQSSTGAPRRSSSADGVKRPALDNGGAESWHGDSNKSPNNQLYQGRLGNKLSDSASPAREKKGSSGDGGKVNSSLASAGRSRFGGGGTKTDDSHSEKNMAVPVFGAWNESDPSSAEDFTMIFTKARDTKMAGGDVNMAGPPKESTTGADYSASHKQQALATKQSSIWTCCFTPSAAD